MRVINKIPIKIFVIIRVVWGAFLVDVGQNPKAFQKWVEPEEETHVA